MPTLLLALLLSTSFDSAPWGLAQDKQDLPVVTGADAQPVRVHVGRLKDALEFLGQPVVGPAGDKLEAALKETDGEKSLRGRAA